MNAGWADLLGLLAGVALAVPVLVLPGYAIARAANVLGVREVAGARLWGLAALAGIAVLSVLDSTVARQAGIGAALTVTVALAAAGLGLAWRDRARLAVGPATLAALAAWIAVAAACTVDVEAAGGLRQSLLVIDLVKHAATTRAIAETGAPPLDPYMAGAGRAGYYYFFYTLCALVHRLGGGWGGLVDPRAAFLGVAAWTAVALVALLGLLLERSGLLRAPRRVGTTAGTAAETGAGTRAGTAAWLALLLPASGLDLLPVARNGAASGIWLPMPEAWTEQVVWFAPSLLWVPHHVAGLLAAWFGLLVLAEAAGRPPGDRGRDVVAVALAAASFASLVVQIKKQAFQHEKAQKNQLLPG